MKKFIYLILLVLVGCTAYSAPPKEKSGLEVFQALTLHGYLLYDNNGVIDTLWPKQLDTLNYRFLMVNPDGKMIAVKSESVNIADTNNSGIVTDPPAHGYAFVIQDSTGAYWAVQSEDVIIDIPETVDTSAGDNDAGNIPVLSSPRTIRGYSNFKYSPTLLAGAFCPVGTSTLTDISNTFGYYGIWKATRVFSRNTEVLTTATSTMFNITKTDNSITVAPWTSLAEGRIFQGNLTPTSLALTGGYNGIWSVSALRAKNEIMYGDTALSVYVADKIAESITGSTFDTNNYKTDYSNTIAYALTTSNANVTNGPVLYLSAGTWEITYETHVVYNYYTQPNLNTVSLNLWRVNNTPAKLNGSDVILMARVSSTTFSETLAHVTHRIYYTTAGNDIVRLRGQVSLAPYTGSIQVYDAHMYAKKL